MTVNNEVIDDLTVPSDPSPEPEAPEEPSQDDFLEREHTMTVKGRPVTKKMREWLDGANKAEAFGIDSLQSRAASGERLLKALQTMRMQPTDEGFDADQVEQARIFVLKTQGYSDDQIRGINEQYRQALQQMSGEYPEGDDDVDDTPQRQRPDPEVEKSARFRTELATRMFNEAIEARLTSHPELATEFGKFIPEKLSQVKELVKNELRNAAYEHMEGRRSKGEEFSLGWIDDAVSHGVKEAVGRLRVIAGAIAPVQGGAPGTTSMFGFDMSRKKEPLKPPAMDDADADKSAYFDDVLLRGAQESLKNRTSGGKTLV